MARGRCVCGLVATACKVQEHQAECAAYAEAYRRRAAGLDPVEAYIAWAASGRKAARDSAHTESVADTDRRREEMAARFATRDILEDD